MCLASLSIAGRVRRLRAGAGLQRRIGAGEPSSRRGVQAAAAAVLRPVRLAVDQDAPQHTTNHHRHRTTPAALTNTVGVNVAKYCGWGH